MTRPPPLPLAAHQIVHAIFVPDIRGKRIKSPFKVFTAQDVLEALK